MTAVGSVQPCGGGGGDGGGGEGGGGEGGGEGGGGEGGGDGEVAAVSSNWHKRHAAKKSRGVAWVTNGGRGVALEL